LSITNDVVEKTQAIIAQFMQSRANQLISSQPNLTGLLAGGRSGRADLSVTQAGGNFDFASPAAADNGMWIMLNGSWSNEDTLYAFGALGSHYAFSPELLVGGMVELDYMRQNDGVAKVDGQGWLAGLYVVARAPNHPLFIDGRVLYGQTTNNVSPLGTYTDSFYTERFLAQVKISGELAYSATTVMPSLQLSYTTDDQQSYTDSLNNLIPAQGVELGQAEFAIDFRHDVALKSDRASLEITGGISAIGSSTRGTGNASLVIPEYEGGRAKLKMGANYTLENGGTLALDAFYDGIGNSGYESYGLRLGFNLAF
jgi:outer membrane autotransporter protein